MAAAELRIRLLGGFRAGIGARRWSSWSGRRCLCGSASRPAR
jgi:hypothetical protein